MSWSNARQLGPSNRRKTKIPNPKTEAPPPKERRRPGGGGGLCFKYRETEGGLRRRAKSGDWRYSKGGGVQNWAVT